MFGQIDLSKCTKDNVIVLLCTKIYYSSETISDSYRFDTLSYVSNNTGLIDELFFDNPNIEEIKMEIASMNNFILNADFEFFKKMFEENTHEKYMKEKFGQMKSSPTYFIVTRDKSNLKNLLIARNAWLSLTDGN